MQHKLGKLNAPKIFFFKDNKAPKPHITVKRLARIHKDLSCFSPVFFNLLKKKCLWGARGRVIYLILANPPPPFPLSSAILERWSMLISTGCTPIRYDMVYVLYTIRITIVMSFVFFII